MQLTGPRASSRLASQAGFSLVEILVATGIGMVAFLTAASFNRFQLFALRNQATQLDVQTTARSVVDLMAREVRRAGKDPTCAKAFNAIAAATSQSIRVQADLDGDGAVTGTNEDITYSYDSSSNTIWRTANGSTSRLMSGWNMTGSKLRYFDQSGTELTGSLSAAQLATVRRVRVELVLAAAAVDPRNSQPLVTRVASNIDLRNRFFVSGTGCP